MESIINTHIPEFKVQAYHNGEFKTVTDKDVLGKWAIFFFYPADFTFVCPTELEDMAEKYDKFKALGVEVYSVSTDSHFVHKAWHDASESIRKIKYPMLADPTGLLSRAFGVMIDEDGMAYRGTFVCNPEGFIKLVTRGLCRPLTDAKALFTINRLIKGSETIDLRSFSVHLTNTTDGMTTLSTLAFLPFFQTRKTTCLATYVS